MSLDRNSAELKVGSQIVKKLNVKMKQHDNEMWQPTGEDVLQVIMELYPPKEDAAHSDQTTVGKNGTRQPGKKQR